jgi:hypothetical protein
VETSILSIDSFRALDTTRIFAMKTLDYFDEEISVLAQFPPKFALNRFMGGNEAARFAGLVGVDAVMRTRDPLEPTEGANEDVAIKRKENT